MTKTILSRRTADCQSKIVLKSINLRLRWTNHFDAKVLLGWPALCMALFVQVTTSAQNALPNGGNQDATLAAGATDSYTVAASSGDRIVLQLAKLSGGVAFTPLLELFAPNGTKLAGASDPLVARLDIQAIATGTYTVTVSDANGTGSGNYRLRLAHVPGTFTIPSGDEGGALTNGASHQGTIDLGDLDLWTVSANPGDRITLQISELSGGAGFSPMIEMFTPDGARLAADTGAVAARIDVQAALGGTYTVLVSDSSRTGTGTYQLQLAHIPGSFVVPNGDEGGALPDGVDTDGAIPLGDLDLWSFNASAGDLVTVQVTELTGGANFAPQIELFAPNGEPKASSQGALSASLEVAIETDGAYTLLVSDATQIGSGTYRLHLTRGAVAPPEANTLTNGSIALGSIAVAGETNRWSFTASAGESIVVRIGETATAPLIPWLRLYGPNGALLGQDFNPAGAEVATRATNAGKFVAIISDGTAGRNQTGNYRISLAKTGSPLSISPTDEGGALVNGTTYLGSIETGDIDAWTFTANAGESIAVRMGETVANSTLIPWLRLYGPNGALLDSDFGVIAAEVTTRATNAGTFLVVAADGTGGLSGTGNYRINLAKTGSPVTISPTDEGGPLVNGTTYVATIDTGDLDVWTFMANVGQSIVARVGEITAGSTLIPWLRLYGPDGTLLNSDFGTAAAEVAVRATNSGTFLLLMGDGTAGFSGTGNYRLSLAMTGSEPTISATDEGGPLVNGTTYLGAVDTGDIDAWTFNANAGEAIVVRMGETVANSTLIPWLRLYGPNGALLSSDFGTVAAEVTARATNTGSFLVVSTDGTAGFSGIGNYRISLAKTGSPLTISPNDEGGSMTGAGAYTGAIDAGDIDAWTFTACAGDIISLSVKELVSGSTLTPWLRLYGKDGSLLKSVFGVASTGFTDFVAPASGTYLVVVSDGTSGLSGSGTYQLTVNGLSDALKLCTPAVAGTKVTLTGIGGAAGGPFTLLSSTEITTPLNLWTPLVTNQFDPFGAMSFTNAFSLNEPRRFFILRVP